MSRNLGFKVTVSVGAHRRSATYIRASRGSHEGARLHKIGVASAFIVNERCEDPTTAHCCHAWNAAQEHRYLYSLSQRHYEASLSWKSTSRKVFVTQTAISAAFPQSTCRQSAGPTCHTPLPGSSHCVVLSYSFSYYLSIHIVYYYYHFTLLSSAARGKRSMFTIGVHSGYRADDGCTLDATQSVSSHCLFA
jgi:hypothetical protein